MLLKVFKSNKVIVLSSLPFLGFSLLYPAFNLESNTYIPSVLIILLTFLLILTTALVLNKTINKSELFNRPYYLTALFYVLLACSAGSLISLNLLIVSNLFLALAISKLFKIKRQISCKGLVFDSSFLILFSSIFYPPYLIFILLPWVCLTIIKSFDFREWLMPLIALFIAGIYFYLIIVLSSSNLISIYSNSLFGFEKINLNTFFVFCFGLIAIGLLLALYFLFQLNSSASNRFKKLSLVLVVFLLLSSIILTYNFYNEYYVFGLFSVFIPVSIVLPFALVHSNKKNLIEVLLTSTYLLLLIAVYTG
jgi:hypothetical protein